LLDLRANPISNIDSTLFEGLNNLRILIFRNCSIEKINGNSFTNLKKLEILEISGNDYKSIESRTFARLDNLRSLQLDYSSKIDSNVFLSLKKLECVYFSIKGPNNFGPFNTDPLKIKELFNWGAEAKIGLEGYGKSRYFHDFSIDEACYAYDNDFGSINEVDSSVILPKKCRKLLNK
jgi:hypothetical protein